MLKGSDGTNSICKNDVSAARRAETQKIMSAARGNTRESGGYSQLPDGAGPDGAGLCFLNNFGFIV